MALTWAQLVNNSEETILKQFLEYVKTTAPEKLIKEFDHGITHNTLGFLILVTDEVVLVVAAVEYYDEPCKLESYYVGSVGWVKLGNVWKLLDEKVIENMLAEYGADPSSDFLLTDIYRAFDEINDNPQEFIKLLAKEVV